MTKKLLPLFSFAMLIALASPGQSTNQLHFPLSGFSLSPLETLPGETTQQALMMFLPANDGFAANVNVQIQPYPGTMEEYVALTLEQFKTAGIKVLQQKTPAKSVVVFEYTGEVKGRTLHWYAKAQKSNNHIYLATATATLLQWEIVATRLKSCVDSFHCDAGEQNSSATPAPPRR